MSESLAERLRALHPADAAEALRDADDREAAAALGALPRPQAALILEALGPERAQPILGLLGVERASDLAEEMSSDDLADLLASLAPAEASRLLATMEAPEARRVRPLLTYPEGTAGALMATEVVTLPAGLSAEAALSRLRASAPDAETIYYVYVVDEGGRLAGVVSLRDLILTDPAASIATIVRERAISVRANEDQEAVARLFHKYSLLALPVVDAERVLVGVVTLDDVLDVVVEEAVEDIAKLSGVGEAEAEETGLGRAAAARLPWLLLAILVELIGARVIEGYAHTLRVLLALAYFIPVLNSMAGNLGIQTVALVVRGFARGEIEADRLSVLIGREVLTAALIAAASGALMGAVALGVQQAPTLAVITGLSMMLALLVASAVGVSMPVLLARMGRDPAVASGPLVTSGLDLTTMTIYFMVASLLLARSV
ncbi:MAG: magnesium transporter [Armatimonadetes bacterium]|nr:magnesium transporter [Armatimonadota bacterium]